MSVDLIHFNVKTSKTIELTFCKKVVNMRVYELQLDYSRFKSIGLGKVRNNFNKHLNMCSPVVAQLTFILINLF